MGLLDLNCSNFMGFRKVPFYLTEIHSLNKIVTRFWLFKRFKDTNTNRLWLRWSDYSFYKFTMNLPIFSPPHFSVLSFFKNSGYKNDEKLICFLIGCLMTKEVSNKNYYSKTWVTVSLLCLQVHLLGSWWFCRGTLNTRSKNEQKNLRPFYVTKFIVSSQKQ